MGPFQNIRPFNMQRGKLCSITHEEIMTVKYIKGKIGVRYIIESMWE